MIGVLLAFTRGLFQALPLLIGPLTMFAFGQLTMRLGFDRPVKHSIKRILELTGGREIRRKTN